MITRFLDALEDTAKNPTWRPAELQAIDAPPALDYRTPDYTANAAKYMDLYLSLIHILSPATKSRSSLYRCDP